MKSRKTKKSTEKMWANDVSTAEVVKYLNAMHKAARTKPKKETGSNDLPRTVQVTKEYLNALRRAVGQLIDPETADVNWWHVEMIDPYGDHEYIPPHFHALAVPTSLVLQEPMCGLNLKTCLTPLINGCVRYIVHARHKLQQK